MKALLLVALIALAASSAFAQYVEFHNADAEVPSEGGCQHVCLGSCRDYVKDRCRSIKLPITEPWKWSQPWKWVEPSKWGMSTCLQVQKQCCKQLGKMQSHCRCSAIKQIIKGDIMLRFQPARMSKVMEKAKHLPVMCLIAPFGCKISMADGNY